MHTYIYISLSIYIYRCTPIFVFFLGNLRSAPFLEAQETWRQDGLQSVSWRAAHQTGHLQRAARSGGRGQRLAGLDSTGRCWGLTPNISNSNVEHEESEVSSFQAKLHEADFLRMCVSCLRDILHPGWCFSLLFRYLDLMLVPRFSLKAWQALEQQPDEPSLVKLKNDLTEARELSNYAFPKSSDVCVCDTHGDV